MFGLMKFHKCHGNKSGRDIYDQHYCGTCKALWSDFGQLSRLFLNYDTVFLAELIASVNNDTSSESRAVIRPKVCFSKPDEGSMPEYLKYVAAVNMVLSALKIEDHVYDGGSGKFRMMRLLMQKKFRKAFRILSSFNVKQAFFSKWLKEQWAREKAVANNNAHGIDFFAEPTAMMTAEVFAKASTFFPSDSTINLRQVGFQFGKLIYYIDCFADFGKDIKSGDFNAFKEIHTEHGDLELLRKNIIQIKETLCQQLEALPIADSDKKQFISRLNLNVFSAINKSNQNNDENKRTGNQGQIRQLLSTARINAAATVLVLLFVNVPKLFSSNLLVISEHLGRNFIGIQILAWLAVGTIWSLILYRLGMIVKNKVRCRTKEERQQQRADRRASGRKMGVFGWLGTICGSICLAICGICAFSCLTSDPECSSDCGDSCSTSCSDSCSDSCECSC